MTWGIQNMNLIDRLRGFRTRYIGGGRLSLFGRHDCSCPPFELVKRSGVATVNKATLVIIKILAEHK
jgi:hypothetical protein